MGIDCFFISRHAARTCYNEMSAELCEKAKINFKVLGRPEIEVYCDNAENFIARQEPDSFDLLYLDPARRGDAGRKLISITDCQPDAAAMQNDMLRVSANVMVKLSPMLDISRALTELKHVSRVMIIGLEGECKEITLLIQRGFDGEPVIDAIDINADGTPGLPVSSVRSADHALNLPIADPACLEPGTFISEPSAPYMKSALFRTIAAQTGTALLHPDTHLLSVLLFGLNHEYPDGFIRIVRPIQTILVCVISLKKLTAFDRSVYDSYSEVDGKTAKPIIILAAVQFTAAFCTVALTFLGPRFFMGKDLLAVPSVLFAGIIYAIAYVGFRYRFGAYQMNDELNEDNIPAYKENEDSALFNAIVEKMEKERLFLQPGLSVIDLAKSIGSNRTYVSTSINSHSGKSFALFVNTYRVEYAKKIMEEDGKLSIAQVGEMSGFASEESFRRNFRIITGKSPSDWVRRRNL